MSSEREKNGTGQAFAFAKVGRRGEPATLMPSLIRECGGRREGGKYSGHDGATSGMD